LKDSFKKSLDFLKKEVDSYNGNTAEVVKIANISTLNDEDEFLDAASPIILSVINLKRDITAGSTALRYHPDRVNQPTKIRAYKNPAQQFETYILFTAYNKDQTDNKYLDGISKLEHVIRCFQEQNVFYTDGTNEVPADSPNSMKLILDIESLSITELNQLWSMLGNKYMPSVLYRMRLITIQHDDVDGGGVVEQFKIKLWENKPDDLSGLIEETDYLTQ
jgi:hypothetical protein